MMAAGDLSDDYKNTCLTCPYLKGCAWAKVIEARYEQLERVLADHLPNEPGVETFFMVYSTECRWARETQQKPTGKQADAVTLADRQKLVEQARATLRRATAGRRHPTWDEYGGKPPQKGS
jgi:hypothetical protein